MAALPLTPYQLQMQVAQIRQRDPEAQVIGIRATGGWQGPETLALDDCCYAVVQANTVLEVREALQAAEERQEPMVLLTRLEQTDLGYDVVARLARSRLFHLDVWERVRALFKARVIDPTLRVAHARKLYRDGLAPTLIACRRDGRRGEAPPRIPLLELAMEGERLSLPELLSSLAARGLRRIFVEGGGVTLSHFIRARCLDRLHVTVCAILIGQGRPGLSLPGVERLDQALRPATRRFVLGEDVLFDCRLSNR